MSSTTTERPKHFKSKIPVAVLKVKSFNKSEEKKENCKKITLLPQASSHKSAGNTLPVLKENCKKKIVKPTSRKISERNEVWKSQPSFTQHSNKTSLRKNTVSKVSKEKYLLCKRIKPSNTAKKDISPELLKVTVKKSGIAETRKAKSSNAALPTCKLSDIRNEDGLVQNEKKLSALQNISEKKNQGLIEKSHFSAQKGIKFEGNEIFRQMILRGRELSPSVCRLAPGVKLSSVSARRPSCYDQVFEVSADPHKTALQAIEKMSANRGRKLTLQVEKKPLSPYRIRNSLYTHGINPEEQVMKSLEAIKAKRLQKSALKSSQKKVTFNLNIEDFPAKAELSLEQKSSANSEDKLSHINEASTEKTPAPPDINHSDTNDEEQNYLKPSKLENFNEHGKSTKQDNCHERIIGLKCDEDCEVSTLVEKYKNVLRPGETSNLLTAESNRSPFCSSKKISSTSLYRNCSSKLMSEVFSCRKNVPQILQKSIDQSKQRTAKMKICTPRPVSYSSNSRLLHSVSPDFLEERNLGNLSNLAPIYTPLVLKNIAKHSAESPDNLSLVKLKLDFAATENDTPRREISEKKQVSSVKNIATATKMLDNLADKECDIFLSNENCAVICGRYLRNPVALTLTEGDEMHFLPIRL